MTEVTPDQRVLPKLNRYPKSTKKMVAKIKDDPKRFRSQLHSIKYFALGDSFVNMFLHVDNAFFIKLKGKSIKGLAKTEKEERMLIQRWVKALPKNVELIFNFGQVDLNLIRYHKVAKGEHYPDETFEEYVDWISTLNRKSTIIGILASPIKPQNIIEVLTKYGTLNDLEHDQEALIKESERTEQVREKWNTLIEAACFTKDIRFINLFDYHAEIQQKFRDQNPKTIHLRYLPCIMEVNKHIPELQIDIQKAIEIEEEYVIQKTQRYYANLKLLEERKRLESMESQETKTDNNSSKDYFEDFSNYEAPQKLSGDNLSEYAEKSEVYEDEDYQNNSDPEYDSEPKQINLNEQKDLMIAKLQIPEIGSFAAFKKALVHPENHEVQKLIGKTLVERGITWENETTYNNQFDSLIFAFDQIYADKKSCTELIKSFISNLEEYFYEGLNWSDANKKCKIQKFTDFLIGLYKCQRQYKSKLFSSQLILQIIKELVVSVYNKVVSKNSLEKREMTIQMQCLKTIKTELNHQISQVYLKKTKGNNQKEGQAFLKFMELTNYQHEMSQTQIEEARLKFYSLIFDQYPYCLFSQRIIQKVFSHLEIQILFYQATSKMEKKKESLKVWCKQHSRKLKNNLEDINAKITKKIQETETIINQVKKIKTQTCSGCCCRCGKFAEERFFYK